MRSLPLTLLLASADLLIAACSGADRAATSGTLASHPALDAPAPSRRFRPGGLIPLWQRREAGDSTFGVVPFVRADAQGVYVWDHTLREVIAFDTAGALRWRAGRAGSAPGEFRRVVDMQLDRTGRVHLLDNETRRVTRLTRDGRLEAITTLPVAGLLSAWLPLEGDRALLLVNASDSALRVVDTAGRTVAVEPHPDPQYASRPLLGRQGVLAGNGRDRWLFAYSTASLWLAPATGTAPALDGSTPDRVPFPQVEVSGGGTRQVQRFATFAPCAICDVSADGDDLYLLSGSTDSTVKRVVDRYSLRDGSYQGSYLLPTEARSIAVTSGRLYAILEDPVPALAAFRLDAGTAPQRR